MNIYDFFNSPDVAEYCQSIGHKFSAAEAAVIVNLSRKHSLKEKHAAYRAIIAKYPDMELPKGTNHPYYKSFHKALEKYIAIEERLLEIFLAPEDGAVYRVYFNDDTGENYDYDHFFTTYNKALKYARNKIRREDEYNNEHPGNYSSTTQSMSIRKAYPDKGYRRAARCARVSRGGKISHLYWNYSSFISKKSFWELEGLLDMYIGIPVPFKEGDLVEVADGGSDSFGSGIIRVIDWLYTESENHSERLYRADLFYMSADSHFLSDGKIVNDYGYFCLDFQYPRRELKGEQRIMKYLSLYEQGEIDLDDLLKLQEYIWADTEAGRVKKHCHTNQIFNDKEKPNLQKIPLPWDEGQDGKCDIARYIKLHKEDEICICALMTISRYLSLDKIRREMLDEKLLRIIGEEEELR